MTADDRSILKGIALLLIVIILALNPGILRAAADFITGIVIDTMPETRTPK